MKASRIAAVIAATLVVIVGIGFLVAGGFLTWVAETQRDERGFVRSEQERFASEATAITVDELRLRDWDDWPSWMVRPRAFTLQVNATPGDEGTPLFIGIAPASAVRTYLAGAPYDVIEQVRFNPFTVDYRREPGAGMPLPPAAQPFWVEQAQGAERLTVEWDVEEGDWAVVVMNADGSPGLTADLSAGLRVPSLVAVAVTLLVAGGVLLLIGVAVLVAVLLGAGRPSGEAVEPGAATGERRGPYPLSLGATLDGSLNRGLWLVKWLLALPHILLLGLLWTAVAVVTLVAGVAILFTGRYPRPLFDFTVGVLRWTWRVSYYAFSVAGTDRYPPFTLEPVDYPATLGVDYPARLNRGLWLVKWLLALPHLVITALFGAGLAFAFTPEWDMAGERWLGWGGGLIGILVLIALVALLVRGVYPRQIFELVMGMNRWNFRVAAYVLLLTDAYPPFRLDQGPEEPGPDPATPSAPQESGPQARPLTRV